MPNLPTVPFKNSLFLNLAVLAALSLAACGGDGASGVRTDSGVPARADGAADTSRIADGPFEVAVIASDTAGADRVIDGAANPALDGASSGAADVGTAVEVLAGMDTVDAEAVDSPLDLGVDAASGLDIAAVVDTEDVRGPIDSGGADPGVTCPSAGGATDGGVPDPIAAPDKVIFYPDVTVSTFAGGAADDDFTNPVGVAIEQSGSLIVSDYDQNRLMRVNASQSASVLTLQSTFQYPFALAFDRVRNILYATTDANAQGRKDSDRMSSTVWTINPGSGAASNVSVATAIGYTRGLGVLSDGRVVASDRTNHLIWLIDPVTGTRSALAGSPSCIGGVNGTGVGASFNEPYGLAVLPDDSMVVADYGLRILRRISKTGVVTSFAGDGGPAGTIDGPAASARFARPQAVAADGNGVVYVSDTQSHRIRRIGPDGTVTTLAGAGTSGFMDGAGSTAQFYGGEGLAVSSDGRVLYIADGTGGSDDPVPYHRIRKLTIGP